MSQTYATAAQRLGWSEHFEQLAEGEHDRERDDVMPYAEVRQLADAGYGALRLPADLGGAGLSMVELIDLTVDLAAADSNVAHVWRNHFLFTEAVRGNPEKYRAWLPDIASGSVFGLGFTETDMSRVGAQDFSTTLTRREDEWRLDGVKHYSTGNLYADFVVVEAGTDDGEVLHAVVPVDRAGVERRDDWDGVGQRFTASGSSAFTDVRLTADEVVVPDWTPDGRRKSPLPQLYLTAVVAGIAARAASESVPLVRGRSRNFFHGLHLEPRHDAMVQATVGRLAADAYAARATVVAAAATLQHALDEGSLAGMEQASLDAARAKVVVDDLATRTTSGLLDAGSASSVRAPAGLDRFWRNARTVIAHNPASYKTRVLGDHLLNGTPPPEGTFF